MMSNLKSYLFKLFVLSFSLILVTILLAHFANLQVTTRFMIIGFAVLIIVSIGTHFLTLKGIKAQGLNFVNLSMLAIVLKLILYLLFIIGSFFILKENVKANLLYFVALYFCYTVFELVLVVLQVNKES